MEEAAVVTLNKNVTTENISMPHLAPNQTLYINNLNEKLKKDGMYHFGIGSF